jgi:glycine cleavage system H lipoate-binding protein
MVAVLVVLTFAVLVLLDYYVFARRERTAAAAAPRATPRATRPGVAAAASRPVPGDVFVQPTFTWSRIGDAGDLYVGVHPLLLDLVGTPLSLDCRAHGERVKKGEPLVKLGRGERRLTVPSPVSGTIELVNYPALDSDDPWSASHTRGGAWLYRVVPEQLAAEMRGWLVGDAALAWARVRYHDLREYLSSAAADQHVGFVMADGGDLPVGVLADMDDRTWNGVQSRVAPPLPPETTP